MKGKTATLALSAILTLYIVLPLLLAGCSSAPSLTKEEVRLRELYHRQVATDKIYHIHPAGFAVRPVLQPFLKTYVKRTGSVGIEFYTEDDMLGRDPKYYAGLLYTYFDGTAMYDSASSALYNLKMMEEHCHSAHVVEVTSPDSTFRINGNRVTEFHWTIANAGTVPLDAIRMLRLGKTTNAQMIGAIIQTDQGDYLAYLVENELSENLPNGPIVCVAGSHHVTETQGYLTMQQDFSRFLNGIRFNNN